MESNEIDWIAVAWSYYTDPDKAVARVMREPVSQRLGHARHMLAVARNPRHRFGLTADDIPETVIAALEGIVAELESAIRIRKLAKQWALRERWDAGEVEAEDCDACDGEAVPYEAIEAHDRVCKYAGHDILDDGGGECTTCGEKLPPCPTCGPYHGRKAPPPPLTDDERVALLAWVRRAMDCEWTADRAGLMAAQIFELLRWDSDGFEVEWWGGYESGKALVLALCHAAKEAA